MDNYTQNEQAFTNHIRATLAKSFTRQTLDSIDTTTLELLMKIMFLEIYD